MPRQARFDFPGAIHHIMNRGFHGNPVFLNDEIVNYYLNCFEQFKSYRYAVIAYCFMPNHSHILLQTGEIHLSKIMKEINSRFASYWKKVNKKNGPVFQGRFKSILVGDDEYLKLVSRYIHRNPLKAKLVNSLGKYKWSSYRYLSGKKTPDWYQDDICLNLFHNERRKAVNQYREFVRLSRKEDEEDYPVHCWGQWVAGSKDLYETVLEKINLDKRKGTKKSKKRPLYSGIKTTKNIIKHFKFSRGKLQKSSSPEVISIRRILVYLLKYYCHWESTKIQEQLKMNKMKLSRDIRYIEHKIKIKKMKLENIEKYLK